MLGIESVFDEIKKNNKTQEVYFGNGGAFSKELKNKQNDKVSGKPVNEKEQPKQKLKDKNKCSC